MKLIQIIRIWFKLTFMKPYLTKTILLGGGAGTGTSSVGKLFAKIVGVKFRSGGMMFRATGKRLGYKDQNQFEKAAEKDPRLTQQVDIDTIEFAKANHPALIESRIGHFFISPEVPDSVRIKLDCPFYVRVKRIASREGKSEDVAREETLERESVMDKRFRSVYPELPKDVYEDCSFDHVVNTAMNTERESAYEIVSFLEKRGYLVYVRLDQIKMVVPFLSKRQESGPAC